MKNVLRPLLLLALTLCGSHALAAGYAGDYAPGDTVDCNFATYRPSTGATFTLAGTPAISAYKDNSTTQSTTGITLSADFDSVTGFHHVRVTTASDGTFYSAGSYFELVITTGTVDSISVTGSTVCSFTLNKVSGLRPTTAARTLDVASTGEAGLDYANVNIPTGVVAALGAGHSGTMQSGSATGTAVLASGASSTDNYYRYQTIFIISGTGSGQAGTCASYVGSTRTCTMGSNWITTPDNTSVYLSIATASGDASTIWSATTRTLSAATNVTTTGAAIPITSSRVDATVGAYQTGLAPLQPTVSGRTLDVTSTGEAGIDLANVGSPTTSLNLSNTTISSSQAVASVSGSVGSVTGNVGGNVTGSVGSVTGNVAGSVASVSGNVGGNVVGSVGSLSSTAQGNIRDIVMDDISGKSLGCILAALAAYQGGQVSTIGGVSTYKDQTGAEVRITGTVTSSGNRTATITCPTYP